MANEQVQTKSIGLTASDVSTSVNATAAIASSAAVLAFADVSGNYWSIKDGQIVVNGKADPATSRVTQLAYIGGLIWQENADNLWWSATSPTSGWLPPGGTAVSPVSNPAAPPLRDSAGNTWSIVNAQVAVNGKIDQPTSRVTSLAIVNGLIWQENADNLWWSTTGPNTAWLPPGGTAVSPFSSPALTLPTNALDTLSTAAPLTGIKATDTNQGGIVTLTISVDQGKVSVKSPAGSSLTATAIGISVSGTLAQVNAALASMIFTGGTVGTAHLTLKVQDSDGLATSSVLPIQVSAAAAKGPQLTVPTGVVDTINVATPIKGVLLAEPNASGSFSLTVSVDQGKLTINNSAGASVTASVGKPVSLSGTLAQVGADLATISFTGATVGTAHVTVAVQDSAGVSSSKVVAIDVQPPATTNPDTLVLNLSEDAYAGDAQFSVAVDGAQLGAPQTVTALHSQNQTTAFTFKGNFGAGNHTVGVSFLNDAWGGAGLDRNLYIDSATFNGTQVASAIPLYANGTANFATTIAATPAPTPTPAPAPAPAPAPVPTPTPPPPSGEVFAASGRGASLLPAGFLSTNGSQIVDASGNNVRVASIGWYGTDGPAGSALQGLWTVSYATILQSIKDDGFNTVRIPWSNADLHTPFAGTNALGGVDWSKNGDLQGLTTLQVFQKIVGAAGQIGLKVIFDHHTDDGSGGQQPNGLWIDKGPGTDGTDGAGVTGTVDAARFQADWVEFAKTFAGNSTVAGFDLDNEPHGASWGGGGATDIHKMFTDVGNAIQAVDPGALIIGEPSQDYNGASPEGDVTMASITGNPVVLGIANKMVYSVHEYPGSITGLTVDSGSGLVQQMNHAWGDVVKNNVAPVWIGEMGANLKTAGDQAWAATLLDYMNGKDGSQGGPTFAAKQQGISGSWWNIGSEGGQGIPDGNQTAWGLGNYKADQQAATDQMLFKPS